MICLLNVHVLTTALMRLFSVLISRRTSWNESIIDWRVQHDQDYRIAMQNQQLSKLK